MDNQYIKMGGLPDLVEPLDTLFAYHVHYIYKVRYSLPPIYPNDIINFQTQYEKELVSELKWLSCPVGFQPKMDKVIRNHWYFMPQESFAIP